MALPSWRLKKNIYTLSRHTLNLYERKQDPDGFLFADGKFKTKIKPEDLPEWYIDVYMYRDRCFVSAKGVKELLYKPNYFTNHLHKDDLLYVSYNQPIVNTGRPLETTGYDCVMFGASIPIFVEAVHKYSNYDVSEIQSEIAKKTAWFEENYPEFMSGVYGIQSSKG